MHAAVELWRAVELPGIGEGDGGLKTESRGEMCEPGDYKGDQLYSDSKRCFQETYEGEKVGTNRVQLNL